MAHLPSKFGLCRNPLIQFDDPATHSILLAFMAQGSSVDPNPNLSLSVLDDHLVALNAILDSWDSVIDSTSIEVQPAPALSTAWTPVLLQLAPPTILIS